MLKLSTKDIETDILKAKVHNFANPSSLFCTDLALEILLDVQGDKFSARIVQVYPPKSLISTPQSSDTKQSPSLKRKRSSSDSSNTLSSLSDLPGQLHAVGINLKISLNESRERDNPSK